MTKYPHFEDEACAYAFVEKRLWPHGPTCPHCRYVGNNGKLQGHSTRHGVHKCYHCRKPFTVKVGTALESSHIPLQVWLHGLALLSGGVVTVKRLREELGIGHKSAWRMKHLFLNDPEIRKLAE